VITVTDIVSFILRYRHRGNAFNHGESPEILYKCVARGIESDCCLVDADCFNRISGVVVGSLDIETRRIHVIGILTTSYHSTIKFAKWFLANYYRDGWKLTATRHGKFVSYDTEKFLGKLLTQ